MLVDEVKAKDEVASLRAKISERVLDYQLNVVSKVKGGGKVALMKGLN